MTTHSAQLHTDTDINRLLVELCQTIPKNIFDQEVLTRAPSPVQWCNSQSFPLSRHESLDQPAWRHRRPTVNEGPIALSPRDHEPGTNSSHIRIRDRDHLTLRRAHYLTLKGPSSAYRHWRYVQGFISSAIASLSRALHTACASINTVGLWTFEAARGKTCNSTNKFATLGRVHQCWPARLDELCASRTSDQGQHNRVHPDTDTTIII